MILFTLVLQNEKKKENNADRKTKATNKCRKNKRENKTNKIVSVRD